MIQLGRASFWFCGTGMQCSEVESTLGTVQTSVSSMVRLVDGRDHLPEFYQDPR